MWTVKPVVLDVVCDLEKVAQIFLIDTQCAVTTCHSKQLESRCIISDCRGGQRVLWCRNDAINSGQNWHARSSSVQAAKWGRISAWHLREGNGRNTSDDRLPTFYEFIFSRIVQEGFTAVHDLER